MNEAALYAVQQEHAQLRIDSERLDWYQAQHTLHKSLEVLYVVDGYELSVMAEDGERVLATYKGETLREAIDQAIRSA